VPFNVVRSINQIDISVHLNPKRLHGVLQAGSLELLPATVTSGVADAPLQTLLPCLLAAMCHPAQSVRRAAIPAADALAKVHSLSSQDLESESTAMTGGGI
jgi:hypothetical protein